MAINLTEVDFEKYEFANKDVVFDFETYPNCFCATFIDVKERKIQVFEISGRKNELDLMLIHLRNLYIEKNRLVGYNNIGFDYPVLHWILGKSKTANVEKKKLKITANQIYKYAQKVIHSRRDGSFGIQVRAKDVIIKQLDLYKMNHFDNKAKATSLKLLEFNMRSKNLEDLPFDFRQSLTNDEIDELIKYNIHDVKETMKFYVLCLNQIKFREELSVKYGFDCTNMNDTKIGEQFFVKKIEETNPEAFYETDHTGRKHRKQTIRESIRIADCIFPYIGFQRVEFRAILGWLKRQTITETKGVFSNIEEHLLGEELAKYAEMVVKKKKFKDKPSEKEWKEFLDEHPKGFLTEQPLKALTDKLDENGEPIYEEIIDSKGKAKQKKVKVPKISYYGCYRVAETLNVVIDGFRYDYGTGGIHGSVSGTVHADDEEEIWDWDVASYYPNMGIANRVYPEHLSEAFCGSYEDFYKERGLFAKGTGENKAIKLGLNAVYGNSNNEHSPFYDPKYTMTITIGGQLSLCMLMERLIKDCAVKIIQCNTDGFTVKVKKSEIEKMKDIVGRWEKLTKLTMESAQYETMYIRDVNNYIAKYTNGKMKMKGAYEFEPLLGMEEGFMHKNHSSLVIQMAVLHELQGKGMASDFIRNHKDEYDFMLRTKVNRDSNLVLAMEDGTELKQQNICRYYVSMAGGKLIKVMPKTDLEIEREKSKKTESETIDAWKRENLEAGWNVVPCNDMDNFKWNIDYDYYINEANKLTEPFNTIVY